jgi:Icc-related predicted phosphoesterase
MSLTIVAISDTHCAHYKLSIPSCDILIHAGDESYAGKQSEVEDFARWFDRQLAKHLVWIPGNHSVGFERQYPGSRSWVERFSPRTHILMHSSVELEGIKIWGSPVTPWFHDWAFNVHRGPLLRSIWNGIPPDTNIVVTHGPPIGRRDRTSGGLNVGCEDLGEVIETIKPKYHIFGHIHEGYGVESAFGTTYVNASIMDLRYNPVNSPIVLTY